ncbi:CAMK/CDPK protein kinase [Phytophthora nicotianae CJ01A1]|uniref:CAMK/CDPK protein kinase n=5 Tax=Phytophthora nicotianae TaxID=4792 RepID=V9F4U8_PHYNI|nr:CAMK/CDPK protein kinase [Phytophthora nicotianae P1569]ETK86459.1 CAMK/CDPK protein kinase [Phytophthora nicotianae]ETO75226.1 CAMK/CDPK protein kinase [Phytophthora nicotianae P1976]ETP16322.1 CAMK/CDPK protein kinase [Phytophthora nicotianae CJ01A1]ETP44375.1 CAMK/CDPK protein kinase [Phytophthora nicotianae P10297]
MGCRQSKADAVVGSTAAPTQREARGSLRDDLTSDLIQHKYVDDINEFFEFDATIGTGHFGCVKHAVSKKSGKEWAVKVVALSNEVDRDALRNEINILKRLHHPQIVRVIASYEDKEHMYMIMQLCKGKELYDHLYQEHRTFSENDVRKIIRALLRALAFLHSNFITHRDLKLENLLLENAENPGSLRLCDFGLSTRFKRGEKLEKPLGTIDYVAPEVLDGDYNEKCDLWSVGVICFELLTGVSPFHAATIDETMGNIYDGVLIFENDVWSKFSPASILFIKSLVKENVDQRLSAEQALDHKWLNEGEMASADGSGAARLQSDKCMLLTNMLSFSQCRKMKQAALLSVALGISEDHIQQEMAAEVFHSMDRNKKGSVSRDEFCSALVECGVSNADAGELFTRINQSKSGHINYLEFIAAVMDQRDIGQSTIKEAFGILDGQKQGRLSLVGLQDLFKNSMVAEEVKEMIASVDTKGDGYVDFEAFQGLFAAPGSTLPQVAEEDSSTTASVGNEDAGSPEKPMVTSQSMCTRNTESTVDSITDRTTPSSTTSSLGYTSGKTEESEAIKADLVHQNDVNVAMVNA